ncbi:hypothetical protein CPB83DRAFT_847567 [Crepidotus variabilis]|uniref:Voltage-gated hydrogen channel 1 n=1 Tax=Crepidotus variabilis TaxID=179855 RepID=A0A9P6EN98_9AGAR|nr:hypothetical protein CPB83DRAFT_847567 [Crepidotus variabilis]
MSERELLLGGYNTAPGSEALGTKPESTYHRCQRKTAIFLEHPVLHKTVITLIATDAACVLADLAFSFLSPGCEPPDNAGSPTWLLVLANISLVITTLFLIEIPLTLWALGVQYMNPFGDVPHAGLHAFDATVILTTFVLEVVLRGKEKELAGLLIMLRLWRLVKLVGGVAVGAGELQEELAEQLADTRRELEMARTRLANLQGENQALKERLSQIGPQAIQ